MPSEDTAIFLFRMELPSNPELLSVVRSAVERVACAAGFQDDGCRSITLAVDEAMTNIVRHAYLDRRGEPIQITARRIPAGAEFRLERIEFLLVDRGRGVCDAEMRGRPLDEIRPGGLGMHFIREIMDEVEYECRDGENRLRLVKYLAAKPSA